MRALSLKQVCEAEGRAKASGAQGPKARVRTECTRVRSGLIVLFLTVVNVLGCAGGSGGGGTADGPSDPVGPGSVTVPVNVVVVENNTVACLTYGGDLFCSGTIVGGGMSPNFNSVPWVRFLDTDDSAVTFALYDDSLFVQTTVVTRPHSRTAGVAVYAYGEATLQTGGYDWVYAGPNYIEGVNGSVDATHLVLPMSAGDMTLSVLTGGTLIIQDGNSTVTQQTLSCGVVDGVTLECPGFSVSL